MKPGEVVAERFEVEQLAGSGGMGAVYRARDRATGELAALKVLWGHTLADPDLAERFGREATVLKELEHPGIVRYIDHGTTPDGEPWLALEWLEGASLSQVLRARSLDVSESLAVARRVAEALCAAHARGIVHRDLKPSNLYLVGGAIEGLKVLDFGIAKVASGAPLTMTGVVIGTPFYMSPEQARGDKLIDARADVFSLGCVLFHCLTGKAPFAGEEMPAALLKVVLEEMPRLSSHRPDIPAAIDDLVARMLAKSPRDRPADASAVALELDAIAAIEASAEGARSLRPSSLTGRELRLIAAVLLRPPPSLTSPEASSAVLVDPPTVELPRPGSAAAPAVDVDVLLDLAVTRHQGKLTSTPDGTWIVTLTGAGAGMDLVARAARCALELRKALPRASMALVAGRGAPNAPLPPDEVLARGRRLLETAPPAPPAGAPRGPRGTAPGEGPPPPSLLRVDDVVGGLLGARFDVGGDAAGLLLHRERDALPAGRTLLGRSTPCVGREHELSILGSVLDQVIGEPTARVVLVTAAPGVGKSRLTSELLRRVEARRSEGQAPIQIWSAQGDPMSAGSPFGMLAQMIRREAGLREGEPREVRKHKLRARVARHLPPGEAARVSQFLGELCGVSFSDQESVELRAARGDPMLMGDQIRRAWEDLIDAETSAHALVLVIEDLHWGDLPSVRLVDAALRALPDRPLFVLALGRPDVHELFPKLWAERGVQEIRLRELSRKGAERLVQEVLGASVDGEVIARIVDRAAGNAFYLEELIRAAADGRSERLPETVLAMVEARLEGLHPEERRVLRAASVFGQTFWRGALPPLLGGAPEGREPAGLAQHLANLCERELLIRRGEGRFPGQEEYAFRHSLLRESAYATLTEADRRLGHRLGARWLEQAGEREATLLAEHFERAGEPERAVQSYRRAAEQALEGNDFQAAVARAERGAAHASGEVLGALRLLQAEAHKWMGSAASAEHAAMEAMDRFPVGSALWYVAAAEAASMRLRLGRHDDLAALAEEVRTRGLARHDLAAAAPPSPGPASRLPAQGPRSAMPSSLPPPPTMGAAVSAVARLAGSLLHDGQHALAEALIVELDRVAAPIAERDYAVAARLYALHASRALCYGDPAAALQYTELSIPSFAFTGDRRNACLGRVNAAHAILQLGDHARAERALRGALADADRMGLHNVSALARQNLGPALGRRGALEEARVMETAAIKAFQAQENRRQEGRSRAYLAQIALLEGDLDAAEAEARAALARLVPIPPLRAFALGVLAQVRIAREHTEEALTVAREGLELLLSLPGMEEGESLLRLVYAEALFAAGNRPAAEDAIDVARKRVLGRAARIVDPGWRASFCENVPENARTLALARAWTAEPSEPS
jgi:serine/threonine protein kinase/tetratricopeptide (TPR) repeat protein